MLPAPRLALVLAVALASALPAAAQGPSPEEKAVMEAQILCVQRAIGRLDDKRSDASTIARGALAMCGSELDRMVRVWTRDMPPAAAQREALGAQRYAQEWAITEVLRQRTGR
jgi:hypothetical protein